MSVLVVGGGFAGLAAAWELARRGTAVIMGWEGEGASSLYSGALDGPEWQDAREAVSLEPEVCDFLSALGIAATPGDRFARVATTAGVLRPARSIDRAVLDLEALRGRRVGVVDFARPGFDAASLARSYAAASWARETGTQFHAASAAPPDARRMRLLSDVDLAECFDDTEFLRAIATELAELEGADGWLLGPWLGLRPDTVERLRHWVKRPLGETLSDPGGAAGCRFEAARTRLVEASPLESWRGTVSRVEPAEGGLLALGGVRVFDAAEEASAERLPMGPFDAVVMALGGLVGGGVRYLSGKPGPKGRTLSLSLDCAASLRLGGREMALHAGAQGVDPQRLGLDALQAVGLAVDDRQRVNGEGLFAAGDVVAARPRTALEAVRSGISAAHAAGAALTECNATKGRNQ